MPGVLSRKELKSYSVMSITQLPIYYLITMASLPANSEAIGAIFQSVPIPELCVVKEEKEGEGGEEGGRRRRRRRERERTVTTT